MRQCLLGLTMVVVLSVSTAGGAMAQSAAEEAATTKHDCTAGSGTITVWPSEASVHEGQVLVVRTVPGPCDHFE